MCGRYTLTQVGPKLVDERFQLGEVALEPATLGRFNVCPTEDILVVTAQGPARGALGPRAVVVEGGGEGAAADQRALGDGGGARRSSRACSSARSAAAS